jgi:hypothetical protein
MTDNTEDRLDELREQESQGNRLDRDDPSQQPDLTEHIGDALDAIEDGDRQETITAYDPRLAALIHALDKDDQLGDVFENLQAGYEGESGIDQPSRSAIIRLATRVGLQEASDETLTALAEAIEDRRTTTV